MYRISSSSVLIVYAYGLDGALAFVYNICMIAFSIYNKYGIGMHVCSRKSCDMELQDMDGPLSLNATENTIFVAYPTIRAAVLDIFCTKQASSSTWSVARPLVSSCGNSF